MLRQYINLPRTIHILCIGAFINRAGSFLLPFLTLYLREELGLSMSFATAALGVFGFGSLVAALVGGHLADLLGRRFVMLLALFGSATILLMFGLLRSPRAILTAILCFALLADMYRPAASAMIADIVGPDRRPQAYGLMYIAINLGFAVAAAVGGKLATWSFDWLFRGDALTTIAYAVILVIMVRETLPSRKRSSPEVSARAEDIPLAKAIRHILTDRVFVVFCFASFCLAIMYMQAFATLPLHLHQLNIDAAAFGWIMSVNGVMIVLLQIPITAAVTQYHRGWMITISAIITAVGFSLNAVAGVPYQFAMIVGVWTIGEMINAPLMSAVISDIAPTRLRARYMGVFSMSFASAMMIGAPLGGLVLARFGGGVLWGGAACVGLLAAVLYASVRNHAAPRSAEQEV
jgi:predicted MFS family arabinose efflux permease